MTEEARAPGITFSMVGVTANTTVTGVQIRRIVLDCEVDDEELWPAIEKQLQELRLHRDEDFHAAVFEAQSADIRDLRAEVTALEKKLAQEKDAKKQAEEELERYKAPLRKFSEHFRRSNGG